MFQLGSLGANVTIAAYFQYELTRYGFTSRGGIARDLFIADKFVFGPALTRAYELERRSRNGLA